MGCRILNHSGRRHKLTVRDEQTLVCKVHLSPKTITEELVKEFEASGTLYILCSSIKIYYITMA